ncbi:hypothetical protein POM88_027810 [Heracleum sosnowskyi]|uniref:Uncharacterized protein n=1 Tax=Heracleum sosnowskyi TaxID=360622 RepID=A0AAD8I8N2_9APIA|nr:hypothetical protein POM88_027810 [Heracleum sosnowskyi]
MISLCFPYKKINLFVDHKKRFETANLPPTSYKFLDVSGKDDEVGGSVVDTGEAELSMDDTEDSDYNFDKEIGSDEEFLSDGEYDSDFASDDELIAARKLRKEHDCDSEELDYNSDELSDQQKGLENAMKEHLPRVEHRLCTRHLYANFRKRFPSGALRKAFWFAACATYPAAHEKEMKAIQRMSKTAHDQLKILDPKSWTKAHFQTHAYADNVENNMSACFNAWIINARYMPLLTMLQELHFMIMSRIRAKREEMLASSFLTPLTHQLTLMRTKHCL